MAWTDPKGGGQGVPSHPPENSQNTGFLSKFTSLQVYKFIQITQYMLTCNIRYNTYICIY